MAAKPRLWRDLSQTTKKRYRGQGVTPSAYNAWNKKTRTQKLELKRLFPNLTGPGAVHARSEQRKANNLTGLRRRAYDNISNVLAPHQGRIGNAQRPGVKDGDLKYQPDTDHIRQRVNAMDKNELLIASVADVETLRMLASDQEGWRPVKGERVNPFWYG